MIKVAKTAGFCFGVKRAVDEVYRRIENGERISTLGPLIHNSGVVADLEKKGVLAYSDVKDLPPDTAAVIRTHGVGRTVREQLEKRCADVIDLTCPFVEKIHRIVREHYEQGYKIVIVGDKNHPEVVGINGWCGSSAFVTDDVNDEIPPELTNSKVCIVAQTTIKKEIFVQIVQNIKKTCQSAILFDTICNATKCRQEEAYTLSGESDLMIVIGGRESSNTRKLYEIAKSRCPDTFYIETFEDLPQQVYTKNKKIGITAGASTPACNIEEVVRAMDENVKKEENFAELFEQYGSMTLNNGDIVEGVVVEVRNNEVIIDLGGFKYNGQLAADQLTEDPNQKPSDVVKPGDTLKVYVVGVNDSEGKVVLSRKKIIQQESWNKIKAAYEADEILEGKIIRAVKGGVIAVANDCQIFIPARQVSNRFIQDLQSVVGETVRFRIIEADEKRKRVVGSVRKVLEEERKAKEAAFWEGAEVGKHYTGAVKSITNFGAFVDLGGVDGLVHISELSWNKIKHPSELVKEGDMLEVYIKDINPETKKISLGFKKAEDNPWVIAENKFGIGDIVSCKIVRILPFGAFAEILPTVDGLIHISQIANERINKPEDVLSIGQVVDAMITEANWETKKISLSIRALITQPEVAAPAEEEADDEPADGEVMVYSTDPDAEVEEPIEVEEPEAAEEPVAEAVEEPAAEPAEDAPAAEESAE